MTTGPAAALITLPTRDLVFATWANVLLHRGATTPDKLARSLLSVFPLVRVSPQHELASRGPEQIWYAFRDGAYWPGPSSEPWRNVDRTVAIVDDEGRFVDADGDTDRIFGLDRASLLGRRLAEFCAPQVRDLADGLMTLVEAARAIETRWLFYRASEAPTHVDFVLLSDEAGSHQHLAITHEVAEETVAAAPRSHPAEADAVSREESTDENADHRAQGRRGLAARHRRPSCTPMRGSATPASRPSRRRPRDLA